MTLAEMTEKLALAHYRVETGLVTVYEVLGGPEDTVVLLEASWNTPPAGIMPLGFGPVPEKGFPFSSIIIEITPDEFEQLQTGRLDLPWPGWRLGRHFARPEEP